MFRFAFVFILSVGILACSTHKANFGYSEFRMDMPISTGKPEGKVVGMVDGSQGGFVWTNCNEQARSAIIKLMQHARAQGGDAVGEVRWRADGSSSPTCKKNWGFVLLPVFLFTPVFSSSHVDGVAYKMGATKKAGLIPLPNTKEEEEDFIAQILALQ